MILLEVAVNLFTRTWFRIRSVTSARQACRKIAVLSLNRSQRQLACEGLYYGIDVKGMHCLPAANNLRQACVYIFMDIVSPTTSGEINQDIFSYISCLSEHDWVWDILTACPDVPRLYVPTEFACSVPVIPSWLSAHSGHTIEELGDHRDIQNPTSRIQSCPWQCSFTNWLF